MLELLGILFLCLLLWPLVAIGVYAAAVAGALCLVVLVGVAIVEMAGIPADLETSISMGVAMLVSVVMLGLSLAVVVALTIGWCYDAAGHPRPRWVRRFLAKMAGSSVA
jgi:hypothetical protein